MLRTPLDLRCVLRARTYGLHEDRRPSLHVYEQPGRGWYCFGCGRGGSALDLAALLWLSGQSAGAPLRGRQFIEVRDRLAAIFADGGSMPQSSSRS